MATDQSLAALKKDVRSLLISAKTGLSPEHLRRDYGQMVGSPLPLRTFGFHSALDMVREMPDVATFHYLGDGSLIFKAVSDENTRGIEELVARQRTAKSNSKAGRRGGARCFSPRYSHSWTAPAVMPRRGQGPPPLPALLRAQLRQLLSQGPVALSMLEPGFAARFGYPLRFASYGFYSIAELLEVAADLVAVHQTRIGSVLSLRRAPEVTPPPPVPRTGPVKSPRPKPASPVGAVVRPTMTSADPVKRPTYPRTKDELAALSKDVFPGSSSSISALPEQLEPTAPDPPSSQKSQSNRQTPSNQPTQSHQETRSSQQTQLFHQSVIKLEEELRQRILENGRAGAVSPELKARLRQVVGEKSEGISIHELPAEYKRAFGEELPVIQSGFLSVTEMVGALSDTLHLWPVPGDQGNHWMVKHAVRTPVAEGVCASGEHPDVSSTGYYFSGGESPWETGREGHALDVTADDYDDDDNSVSGAELYVTHKTYHRIADRYPMLQMRSGEGTSVPPDALRGQRLRPPTRRRPRELAAVLVERAESPSHFYVRFEESPETRALENMMIEMRSCYFCPQVSERYRLPERYVRQGQVCCVASRNMWYYRVVVHRVLSPTEAEVYYVDFGDFTTVLRANLKFLKSCYSELPAQAVPSCLAGVKPTGASWSAGATECFQDLCCERTLVAALHAYHRDFLLLFLCDTHTEDDVYIHSALQAQGYGQACAPALSAELFGALNPVTLYLGDGLIDGGMDMDEETTSTPSPSPTPAPTPVQAPNFGRQASTASKEDELADLPALEFIEVTEVSSQAQGHEANPFGALLSKEPVLGCTTWDQGWTPDPAPEEVVRPGPEPCYLGDAAETPAVCEPRFSDEEEKQLWTGGAGFGVPPSPPATPRVTNAPPVTAPPIANAPLMSSPALNAPPLLPTLRTLSLHTPGLMQTQGSYYGLSSISLLSHPPNFIFPFSGAGTAFSPDKLSVHHTSSFVLGSSARLAAGSHYFSWCAHK